MTVPNLATMRAACDSSMGIWQSPGVVQSLALASMLFALALSLFVRRRLLSSETQEPGAFDASRIIPWRDLPEILSPLLCGLIILLVFLSALTLSRFYGSPIKGAAFEFMGIADTGGKGMASEQGARGLWAVAVAALILAEIAVAWTVTGLWCQARTKWNSRLALSSLIVAVIVAALFAIRAGLGGSSEFGSSLVGDLVCIASYRSKVFAIGPITDGLNVLGLVVPLLVAFGFCLVLVPPPVTRIAEGVGTRGARRQRAHNASFDADLQWHARRQKALDQILYVGAAVLVAGLIEVVTLVSWSYAPFQGTAELKMHVDICKGPGTPVTATMGAVLASDYCKQTASLADSAESVDEARKFTQSLALIYGATFSAFLVSFYLPAALILQRRLRSFLIAQGSTLTPEELSAKFTRFDVDRTLVQQGITLAVSLAPMIAGVVASLLKV